MSASSSSDFSDKARLPFVGQEGKRRKSKTTASQIERVRYTFWTTSALLERITLGLKQKRSRNALCKESCKALRDEQQSQISSSSHNRTIVRTGLHRPIDLDPRRCSVDDTQQYQCLNFATACPSGFQTFEHNTLQAIQHAVAALPSTHSRNDLQRRVEAKLAQEFQCRACHLSTSIEQRDELVRNVVKGYAQESHKPCILLMGTHRSLVRTQRHSDMVIHHFNPENLKSLEAKLKTCKSKVPAALLSVWVEGLTSSSRAVIDLPQILALKERYGFLLILDESYSFLAVGSHGRGVIEHFNSKGFDVGEQEIDIITADLNHSIGANGGVVLLGRDLADRAWHNILATESHDSLSPAVLLRLVTILEKPTLIQHRMRQLTERSNYVRRILQQGGLELVGLPGSPYISFIVGSPRQAIELWKQALKRGIMVSCKVPHKSSRWNSTIQLTIPATLPWKDIRYLVETLTWLAIDVGVRGAVSIPPDPAVSEFRSDELTAVVTESLRVNHSLETRVEGLGDAPTVLGLNTRRSLLRFGLSAPHPASGDIYEAQVDLERCITSLYEPMLTKNASSGLETFASPQHIRASSSFLLSLPQLTTKRRQKKQIHECYVYAGAPTELNDSLKTAVGLDPSARLHLYVSISDLIERLSSPSPSLPHGRKSCRRIITICLQTSFVSPASRPVPRDFLDLNNILARVMEHVPRQPTKQVNIFLDDSGSLGALGLRQLGLLDYNANKVVGSPSDSQDFAFAEKPRSLSIPSISDSKIKLDVFLGASFAPIEGVGGGFILGDAEIMNRFRTSRSQYEKMSAFECGILHDWLEARAGIGT